jgi:hypothetical protein
MIKKVSICVIVSVVAVLTFSVSTFVQADEQVDLETGKAYTVSQQIDSKTGEKVLISEEISPSTGGLVSCGKGSGTADNPAALNCDFAAAIAMINTLINYLIMISMPLAAVGFAWGGWLYLTAGGESGIEKSKKVFTSVGIGIIVILSGWLVFKLIETTFLNTNNGYATYLN